jgi:hypothetical protein
LSDIPPEFDDNAAQVFRMFEEAHQNPYLRIGGIHDAHREEIYPGVPGITLHITWLEKADDESTQPSIIAMNLHIPATLIPALMAKLSQVTKGLASPHPRPPHARKHPRKRKR